MAEVEAEVVATLLIRRPWDSEYLRNWKPDSESESHPGDLGNLMFMRCYDNQSVIDNADALNHLAGVEEVIVVYGDTDWHKYAAENGIELKIYDCKWCDFEGGNDVIGPAYYWTGK